MEWARFNCQACIKLSASFKLYKPFVSLTMRNQDSEGDMCYGMSQTESTEGTKLDV